MKFQSIHDKLNRFSNGILFSAMASLAVVGVILGIIGYGVGVKLVGEYIKNNLLSKGKILVTNNRQAMLGMAQDNAFAAIRELVAMTVKEDGDVIYGIFMDHNRRPWAVATQYNPGGEVEHSVELNDSISNWATSLKEPGWISIVDDGIEAFEFAAPVENGGIRHGTIRYGISTQAMRKAINEMKNNLFAKIIYYPVAITLIAFVLFIIQSRLARRQSEMITRPLQILTESAEKITSGNYTFPINTTSNDEIGVLSYAFEKMRLMIKQYTDDLEKLVEKRTEELRMAQQELVEKAHRAGMADIATGTLHNVGNILNSVKTSADAVVERLGKSVVEKYKKAGVLLRENIDTIDTFLINDPRGKKLMLYYLVLEDALTEELVYIRKHTNRVNKKVISINDVITAQQNYAGAGGMVDEVSLIEVIEDSLTMQSGTIERYGIRIIRDYKDIPLVKVQKTKLVHVLINLIKNAKEAMDDTTPENKVITVTVGFSNCDVLVKIKDEGVGIEKEQLTRVFNHGFTTKKGGHGFGLHSSANYMKEMGGNMWAESGGTDNGVTMNLLFPAELLVENCSKNNK